MTEHKCYCESCGLEAIFSSRKKVLTEKEKKELDFTCNDCMWLFLRIRKLAFFQLTGGQMITKKINDNDYIFECPKCDEIAHIDKEQAEGKVSIMHDEKSNPKKCDYHETKNWLEEER